MSRFTPHTLRSPLLLLQASFGGKEEDLRVERETYLWSGPPGFPLALPFHWLPTDGDPVDNQ